MEDFSHNILRTKCIMQLLSASLDITFYYNFYIKVVIKTSDIKKSKRTKLERTAMITLKKRKVENKKMKRERKKYLDGHVTHLGARHHKRKEKPLLDRLLRTQLARDCAIGFSY